MKQYEQTLKVFNHYVKDAIARLGIPAGVINPEKAADIMKEINKILDEQASEE